MRKCFAIAFIAALSMGWNGDSHAVTVDFDLVGYAKNAVGSSTILARDPVFAKFSIDTDAAVTVEGRFQKRYGGAVTTSRVVIDWAVTTPYQVAPLVPSSLVEVGNETLSIIFNFDGNEAPFRGSAPFASLNIQYKAPGLLNRQHELSSLDTNLLATLNPTVFFLRQSNTLGQSTDIFLGTPSVPPVPVPAALPLLMAALSFFLWVGYVRSKRAVRA